VPVLGTALYIPLRIMDDVTVAEIKEALDSQLALARVQRPLDPMVTARIRHLAETLILVRQYEMVLCTDLDVD